MQPLHFTNSEKAALDRLSEDADRRRHFSRIRSSRIRSSEGVQHAAHPLVTRHAAGIRGVAAPQTAAAQTTFNSSQPAAIFGPAVTPPVNPDIVVARLMTFDRDNDGRLVRSELPERMQNLLASDASGDQALDRDEIRALATAPRLQRQSRQPFPDSAAVAAVHVRRSGQPVHAPARRRRAGRPAADAGSPVNRRWRSSGRSWRSLEADATAVLLNELEGLVQPVCSLAAFKAHARSSAVRKRSCRSSRARTGSRVNVFRFGPDLTQVINGFALPPEQTSLALAAFDRFKARIRPGGRRSRPRCSRN